MFLPNTWGCFTPIHPDVLGKNIRVFLVFSPKVSYVQSLCENNSVYGLSVFPIGRVKVKSYGKPVFPYDVAS